MEVPLPWERLLWSGRSFTIPGSWYALTDFRLVVVHRDPPSLLWSFGAAGRLAEIAIYDISSVRRHESALDRVLGTSTIVVRARQNRQPPVVLTRVRRGLQLAALIELLAADPHASLDVEAARAALLWKPGEPRTSRGRYRDSLVGVGVLLAGVFALVIGLHGRSSTAITYPADDAIYPGGEKRDHDAIVRFMEADVMPWARQALSPIVGGSDRVTCQTCHGRLAEARAWHMPAVAALPKPDLASRGWETNGGSMDAQIRNAIYGYMAASDNQDRAAYMRQIVMPGMARLLHRPAYDFTKSYDYNRTHFAFGCYHCHNVE